MKHRIKGFLLGVTLTLLVVCLIIPALASVATEQREVQFNNIDVTLDGQTVVLNDANGNPVEPFVIDGTTYLPVRAVADALGLNVNWNGETTTVELSTASYSPPQRAEQSNADVVLTSASISGSAPAAQVIQPAESGGSQTVYITRTGSKYHYNSSCNGGTYFESTMSQALAKGLTPCAKCVLN